jgi:hypothetical protein
LFYTANSYGPNGFTAHYTLVEYLMGVTTEWLACVLFLFPMLFVFLPSISALDASSFLSLFSMPDEY